MPRASTPTSSLCRSHRSRGDLQSGNISYALMPSRRETPPSVAFILIILVANSTGPGLMVRDSSFSGERRNGRPKTSSFVPKLREKATHRQAVVSEPKKIRLDAWPILSWPLIARARSKSDPGTAARRATSAIILGTSCGYVSGRSSRHSRAISQS